MLRRLLAAAGTTPGRARRVMTELLTARLGDVVVVGDAVEEVRGATDEQVKAWQRRVAVRLRTAASLRGTGIGGPALTIRGVTLSVSTTDVRFEVSGPPGRLLGIQETLLVRLVGRERLRICECGRVFVREGKRLFCSQRCQKRVYMRRYRDEIGRE